MSNFLLLNQLLEYFISCLYQRRTSDGVRAQIAQLKLGCTFEPWVKNRIPPVEQIPKESRHSAVVTTTAIAVFSTNHNYGSKLTEENESGAYRYSLSKRAEMMCTPVALMNIHERGADVQFYAKKTKKIKIKMKSDCQMDVYEKVTQGISVDELGS